MGRKKSGPANVRPGSPHVARVVKRHVLFAKDRQLAIATSSMLTGHLVQGVRGSYASAMRGTTPGSRPCAACPSSQRTVWFWRHGCIAWLQVYGSLIVSSGGGGMCNDIVHVPPCGACLGCSDHMLVWGGGRRKILHVEGLFLVLWIGR